MSRKIQRKEQILDAALYVIVQNGYHQSRMDDIVSTSGLSKGAIYWYYKSKKDMYLDLVNHWVIRYSNSLLKLPQEDISSGEQLKNLFETFFDQFEKDPIVFKALLEFWSLAGRDKDFKIKLEKVTQNFIHYIEYIIKRIERSYEKIQDTLIFHYNKYDREYENGGYLDEFNSESLVTKAERKVKATDKFSFGYGSEYKYNWAAFEDRGSYNASTRGYIDDFAVFGNIGYKFSENTILSLYSRQDKHKTTGRNYTYKLNLTKAINKFEFGATHSTGLRNPTLYELYGTNNYGHKGDPNLNPEKSETNELSSAYNFSDNAAFKITAYQSSIIDYLDDKADWSGYENKTTDLEQEGLQNLRQLTCIDNHLIHIIQPC